MPAPAHTGSLPPPYLRSPRPANGWAWARGIGGPVVSGRGRHMNVEDASETVPGVRRDRLVDVADIDGVIAAVAGRNGIDGDAEAVAAIRGRWNSGGRAPGPRSSPGRC
jgi:hypothetical protein